MNGRTDLNLRQVRQGLEFDSIGSKGLLNRLVNSMVEEKLKEQNLQDNEENRNKVKNEAREELAKAFNDTLYERFFMSGPIRDILNKMNDKSQTIREWEVPMIRLDIDNQKTIVDGVSVVLGNNVVRMQVQMQEEPTYQFIGR
jgi:hypothetical protein